MLSVRKHVQRDHLRQVKDIFRAQNVQVPRHCCRVAGYVDNLRRPHPAQQLQRLRPATLARRVQQYRRRLGRKTRQQRRQKFLRGPRYEFAVGASARNGVPPRRLDRQTVQLHADKGLDQVTQLKAEEANTAIYIHEMACPAAAQAITHGFQQLGQQEEVILKERIRRHFPTLGRDAQDYLDSAFGRRMRTDELDLLVERGFGDFAFLQIHYQPVVGTEETDVQALFELIPLAADHNTRSDELDLLVERGFGDFAFLQIHYQPVVGTEETDVQALFELIPLAADHNTVAVAVRLRAGNHWRNKTGVKLANPLEQIGNLLVFELELDRISQMLILATATLAEVRAERFDPVGGGSHNTKEPSPGEALLYFRDLCFHDLALGDERNEDDKVLHPGDPFATEGNIANRQGQLVA